jgi:hypothetical protein
MLDPRWNAVKYETVGFERAMAERDARAQYRDRPFTVDWPLYHGGRGGFDVGDTLLPPSVTGYLRPQAMGDGKLPYLLYKKTYDPAKVYATRAMNLALTHAAGWSNWSAVTGAADEAARYGSVYEVEPYRCLAEVDPSKPFALCCCNEFHPEWFPCSVKADRFLVKRVVERDVKAVETGDWKLIQRHMKAQYALWKQRNGGEWYGSSRSSSRNLSKTDRPGI